MKKLFAWKKKRISDRDRLYLIREDLENLSEQYPELRGNLYWKDLIYQIKQMSS